MDMISEYRKWTENEILNLAAGVESNTNHPVGKAITEAARAAGCHNVKVIYALGTWLHFTFYSFLCLFSFQNLEYDITSITCLHPFFLHLNSLVNQAGLGRVKEFHFDK